MIDPTRTQNTVNDDANDDDPQLLPQQEQQQRRQSPQHHSTRMAGGYSRVPLLIDSDEDEEEENGHRPRNWTYEEAIDFVGMGKWHIWLVLVCGWANASDAVEVLCVSLVIPFIQCGDLQANSGELGYLTAVIFVGMMFGGYFWGSVGDVVGRRPVMISALFVNGLFGFISSFMTNFWAFLFFRFVSGVGVGGSIPIIWSYFSEFQPSNIRGRMLSIIATFWMVGTLLFSGLGWILLPMENLHIYFGGWEFPQWRIFLAIATFTCFSASALTYFLPESPKYLLEKGKEKEALQVLAKIYAFNTGNSVHDFPIRRIEENKDNQSRIVFAGMTKWQSLYYQTAEMFHRPLLWTTLLMLIINFALSFGSYGLTFWLPELFTRSRGAGATGSICSVATGPAGGNGTLNNYTSPHNSSADCSSAHFPPQSSVYRDSFIVAVASLPGNLLTIGVLDKFGRRPIFFIGAIMSALSVFGIYLVSTQTQVLIMSCIFNATSVLCWNCLDAFSTELFPTHLRATSMGLCLAMARVGAILGNLLFGQLVDQYCAVPIILVAIMLGIAALASIRLKETTNVALD